MSQIPTPPSSRGVSAEPPNEECESTAIEVNKVQLLDELLEHYLQLLDRHQKLQESLGKQLASGFFQLTHANYCSPGRRFGEDFYDERMKATRRLKITSSLMDKVSGYSCENTGLRKVQFEVNYKSVLEPEDVHEEDKNIDKEEERGNSALANATATTEIAGGQTHDNNGALNEIEEDKQKPGISATPPSPSQTTQDSSTDGNVDATNNDDDHNGTKKVPPRKLFRSDDPVAWYGILVPPSLRRAQQSFTEAVNDGIPQLVTVAREMQRVENLVHKLRRQIKTTA
ncbi:hypothetical protein UA08_01969 [Talaromyces atroroseus]|uniref:Vacuolar ATPase assembly protein VMA22 n=1 Tax=Talaromyces atroroseus TaxID=1441469 RepID=A0A1Q5QC22_TALAT|nr:hypothetical protein UA08_01969 [Talaromyces atroroseus]OKL63483.1 hypothetical protein UA08_01969 [Talaromyces atroroseus]